MEKLIKLPHLLYDSLYADEGTRMPEGTYLFSKYLGQPLWPLWHTGAGRGVGRRAAFAAAERGDGPQVQFTETNMRMANSLPMPEAFSIKRPFLCADTRQNVADILERVKFRVQIGSRDVIEGKAASLECFAHHPQEFFTSPNARIGSFAPPAFTYEGEYSGVEIEPGMYFSVELIGGPMKLSSPLMLWFCLMGTWTGPGDSKQ
jgi:hypothetical protein